MGETGAGVAVGAGGSVGATVGVLVGVVQAEATNANISRRFVR
jgi:hypothetical protein